MLSHLTPIVALGTGRILLAEPIPPRAFIGLAVILADFLILEEREIAAELARFRGAAGEKIQVAKTG